MPMPHYCTASWCSLDRVTYHSRQISFCHFEHSHGNLYISIALWTLWLCRFPCWSLFCLSIYCFILAGGSLNSSPFLKVLGPCSEDGCYVWSSSFFSHINCQNVNTARSAFQSWQQSPEISLLTSGTPLLLTKAILCLHVYWAAMWPQQLQNLQQVVKNEECGSLDCLAEIELQVFMTPRGFQLMSLFKENWSFCP